VKWREGASYRLTVYETNHLIGAETSAGPATGIHSQIVVPYPSNSLVVKAAQKIKPLQLGPDDFVGRQVLLSGIAVNEGDTAFIKVGRAMLRLQGGGPWSAAELGKEAEVYGTLSTTAIKNRYDVKEGRARLVQLQDQIGRQVSLRAGPSASTGIGGFATGARIFM
jgi:hypothetical protein